MTLVCTKCGHRSEWHIPDGCWHGTLTSVKRDCDCDGYRTPAQAAALEAAHALRPQSQDRPELIKVIADLVEAFE